MNTVAILNLHKNLVDVMFTVLLCVRVHFFSPHLIVYHKLLYMDMDLLICM